MELKLEVELNSNMPDELLKLSELVREGWNIARIDKEVEKDSANNDVRIILLRD